MTTTLATRPAAPTSLAEWLAHPDTPTNLGHALPATVPADRFLRVLKDAVNANPDLRKCSWQSVSAACAKAAKDGLMIDGREAALVVFKGQASYIPMVAGLRKLVFQSKEVVSLETGIVYANELNDRFDYQAGTDGFLRHRPMLIGERGDPVVAYSVAKMLDGSHSVEVMRWDDITKIAKDTPIWRQHQGEMARKTVMRRHYKSLPSSTDAGRTYESMDEMYETDGETHAGEISTPEPSHGTGRKQAGAARDRLRAVQTAPVVEHDEETGEVAEVEAFDLI